MSMINKNPEKKKQILRKISPIATIITIILVIIAIIFLIQKTELDINEIINTLKNTNPIFFFLALLAHYISFFFRGIRWKNFVSHTTNHKDKISPIYFTCLIIIGWFINSITWFRLGDAYRSYLLSKKANVQLSTLIGTIVAERFVDTAVIFLFLCISFALISLQSNFLNPIYLIIGGITLIILILLLIFLGIFRNFISKILPNIFKEIFINFYRGVFDSFKKIPSSFALTICIWTCEFTRLYLVGYALNIDISVGIAIFVNLANAMLSLIPFTPGGIGIVDIGMTGLLSLSLTSENAVSIAILDRLISYFSVIVIGLIIFLAEKFYPIKNSNDNS